MTAAWNEEWIGRDHPVVLSGLQGVFLRRSMVATTNESVRDDLSALMKVYGYNGSSRAGWARMPDVEGALELAVLGHKREQLLRERARRRGEPLEDRDLDPAERLFRLRLSRWIGLYFADQRRQRAACEALGIEWPPTGNLRPFLWAWERGKQFVRDAEPRPVVYPADWRRDDAEPDAWGFGDRWRVGEILVIGVDEIPVDAEIVRERPRPSQPAEPRKRERVIDAEPVEPEIEAPPSTEVVPAPLPELIWSGWGGGRVLGHVDGGGGFVPGGGSSW
jgi:hypothetical protein